MEGRKPRGAPQPAKLVDRVTDGALIAVFVLAHAAIIAGYV